jgi:outer membrane protein W
MKNLKILIISVFLTSLSVGVASAQESDSSDKYHPFLSTTFQMGLGAYRPTKKNKIGAGTDLGDDNLQGSLDSSENQTTGMLNFRWRYTDNWTFQGNLWQTSSDSRETLNENYDSPISEDVFLKGSTIGFGTDLSIARLFWGRSFNRTASTDWGVGLGLHWMEIEARIEGKISATDPAGNRVEEFAREKASVGAPLPNLGIWYMYSWSPKWVVITRLDWLDVTFEEFSGSMLDASVGVNYQISDHFGVGLAVNAFELDVRVDSEAIDGVIETSQYGPRLNLTWNW